MSMQTQHGVEHVACHTFEFPEPDSIEDALASKSSEEWSEATENEYKALMENETWELVTPPNNRKHIGCMWVFKAKRGSDGVSKAVDPATHRCIAVCLHCYMSRHCPSSGSCSQVLFITNGSTSYCSQANTTLSQRHSHRRSLSEISQTRLKTNWACSLIFKWEC